MAVSSYKCLNCQAPLAFDPESGQWKCDYCFGRFTKEELDRVYQEESIEEMKKLSSYHCNNCGAEIVADETTAATFCIYCKSPSLIQERFHGEFHPRYIIPFKLKKDEAEALYKEWMKKKLFAPRAFKQDEEIEKIKGVYVPFWLFDCDAHGNIQGQATKVKTWTSGDYRYTNTKYYYIERQGIGCYENIPVDGSTKFDDKYVQLIEPYNYQEMQEFSMHYITGFFAEKYDVDAIQSQEVVKERVQEYITDRLKNTVSGYTTFSVKNRKSNVKNATESYAMLPIYLLVNEFNDEKYMFLVNGQTGTIAGETPISHLRQIVFWLLTFFGLSMIYVIFAIIWYMTSMGGGTIG